MMKELILPSEFAGLNIHLKQTNLVKQSGLQQAQGLIMQPVNNIYDIN